MKSYKEYYQFGLEHYLDWKSKQNDEWWRRNELKGKLNLEGDYIETINVLSEYEKNDFMPHGNFGRADPIGTEYSDRTEKGVRREHQPH